LETLTNSAIVAREGAEKRRGRVLLGLRRRTRDSHPSVFTRRERGEKKRKKKKKRTKKTPFPLEGKKKDNLPFLVLLLLRGRGEKKGKKKKKKKKNNHIFQNSLFFREERKKKEKGRVFK